MTRKLSQPPLQPRHYEHENHVIFMLMACFVFSVIAWGISDTVGALLGGVPIDCTVTAVVMDQSGSGIQRTAGYGTARVSLDLKGDSHE